MTELTKIWLEQLYDEEIEEVKGTISNERGFLKGSADAEEMLMHQDNIEELLNYLETLQELKKGVE